MSTVYVGGLRARLIKDSVYYTLNAALDALGWYDPARKHAPVTFEGEAQDTATEIPLNTLALSDEAEFSRDLELGSNLAERPWTMYVDLFAESDSLGLHLIRDVKDILEGRMPSIGRDWPAITVMDWTMATPAEIFRVDVEQVRIDRAHNYPHPYLRHWYSCQFQIVDAYNDENG